MYKSESDLSDSDFLLQSAAPKTQKVFLVNSKNNLISESRSNLFLTVCKFRNNFKLETNYIIKGIAEVWLENDDGIVEKKIILE